LIDVRCRNHIAGMNREKIVTNSVRKVRARSEEKSKLNELEEMLDEMLAETGGPLSARERKIADAALGRSGRLRKRTQ
jgi:thiazole synthase ThiGH ThiG subunit